MNTTVHHHGRPPLHLSFVAEGLTAIPCAPQLQQCSGLRTLNLHSNNVTAIDGLQHLVCLEDLNLSSNSISTLQGLPVLPRLVALNISGNQLRNMDGLCRLHSLESLKLAHNYVTDLKGLAALQGPTCALSRLDLRNNRLASLTELAVLACCPSLAELELKGVGIAGPGNLLCQNTDYRAAVAAALPQVQLLDGAQINREDIGGVQDQEALTQQMASIQLQLFESEPPLQAPGTSSAAGRAKACFPKTDKALSSYHRRHRAHKESNSLGHIHSGVQTTGSVQALAPLGVGHPGPCEQLVGPSPYLDWPTGRLPIQWHVSLPLEAGSGIAPVHLADIGVQACGGQDELHAVQKEMDRLKKELQMMSGKCRSRLTIEEDSETHQQTALVSNLLRAQTDELCAHKTSCPPNQQVHLYSNQTFLPSGTCKIGLRMYKQQCTLTYYSSRQCLASMQLHCSWNGLGQESDQK